MSPRVFLASIWTAIVVAVCVVPGRWLPPAEVSLSPVRFPHLDKLVHAGLFAVFSVLWMWAGRSPKRWSRVLAGGLGLAILTELVQGMPVIGRDSDLLDALADVFGALIGFGFYRVVETRITEWRAAEARS